MCTAKAITNGYFPFGALMLSPQIVDVFENAPGASGFVGHGYTYSGHPVGAAAALACLKETIRLDVPANAAARGTQMFEGLNRLKMKHELIGDVRGGYGLMSAIELVSDRATKAPLDKQIAIAIQEAIYSEGVMVRVSGPNLILSPPLIVTEQDVSDILSAIDNGMKAGKA